MSAPAPVFIQALVDGAERAGLIAAAEQLSVSLGAAAGAGDWPVRVQFDPPGCEHIAAPAPSAVIASLLPEAAAIAEPLADTEARWRAYLTRIQAFGAPVFICTIFRHLRDRPRDGSASPLLERIRRLNRMAATLSHELGVAVIDIDRAFTHIGGRILRTDHRLGGVLAAEVAGHTCVWSLLSFGLDDAIAPDLQDKARTLIGGLQTIDNWLGPRLAARAAAMAARSAGGDG